MTDANEHGVVFKCGGESLVGVLHSPATPRDVGVVIVVGGPSYRVGSHRQFVLLARRLASAGYPVLRFDYRGMGDSSGGQRSFEAVEQDIVAAVRVLKERAPHVQRIALWGLCDGATAISLAAPDLADVAGVALLNPWVRSEATIARTHVKNYYLKRLVSADFWRKLWALKVDVRKSAREFTGAVGQTVTKPAAAKTGSLAERLLVRLYDVKGSILVILSGNDLTAAEFREAVAGSIIWIGIRSRDNFARRDFAEANHTFSRREWRERVEEWTLAWLAGIG